MNKKIVITANTFWNISNFRLGLLNHLVEKGFKITVIAPPDKSLDIFNKFNFKYIPIKIDRKGKNIFNDLIVFFKFFFLFLKEKPNIILTFTIKPNIYASLAAHSLNIPVVNNISGLGSAIIKENFITLLVNFLYKIAFFRSKCILFENKDDLDFFVIKKIVKVKNTSLIPGCGIDINHFAKVPIYNNKNFFKYKTKFRFILIARLLRDKGIFEYVEACKLISKTNKNVEFGILGFIDENNPTGIKMNQINIWVEEEILLYFGETDDVRPYIYESDCVVLPSYREGTPKALLEASAMRKPLIATNTNGCKEVVVDNKNGFLCKVKDGKDLSEKMNKMINISNLERKKMGDYGYEKVNTQFNQKIINQIYLTSINKVLEISN